METNYLFQELDFVGRDSELLIINNAIKLKSKSVIIAVSGKGGIGKSRLLAQVVINLDNTESIKYMIIDIADSSYRYELKLLDEIINKLNIDHFTKYKKLRSEYIALQQTSFTDKQLIEKLNDLFTILIPTSLSIFLTINKSSLKSFTNIFGTVNSFIL